jgi:hypothetical protein
MNAIGPTIKIVGCKIFGKRDNELSRMATGGRGEEGDDIALRNIILESIHIIV